MLSWVDMAVKIGFLGEISHVEWQIPLFVILEANIITKPENIY